MRLFSVLVLASTLSAPAFAADLGTYRPGAPYNSIIAPAADICQNQCAGDAQCRGWNYVKVNPRAPGVCEFNSKPASPIESAISISGEGASLLGPNISVGSTNTVRVGTAPAPSQRDTVRRTSPNRRVVRQALPQQIRPEQTVARRPISNRPIQNGSLQQQQNYFRQQTGHAPEQFRNPNDPYAIQQQTNLPQYPPQYPSWSQAGSQAGNQTGARALPQIAPQQRLLRDPRVQYQHPGQAHQFNHNLEGSPQQLHQLQQSQMQVPQTRPPIGVPIVGAAPQGPLVKASVNNPITHQNDQVRIQEAQIAAEHHAPQIRGTSFHQAQASLFGNLNDDVNVPRPLFDLPFDQNAPIATSQSRPTTPVIQESLGVLAGG